MHGHFTDATKEVLQLCNPDLYSKGPATSRGLELYATRGNSSEIITEDNHSAYNSYLQQHWTGKISESAIESSY